MALQINDKLITIIPKTEYIRGEELIKLRHDQPLAVGCDSADQNGGGLKKTMPSGTDEEVKTLEHLCEQFAKQLSKPRIERLAGRTLAKWDENLHAVRVIRKDGKFQNYGYNHQGQHYLEYYEAMFLLEMNRMQLEYHGQIMSIEQAYLLLMGENASEKYSNYLIYSYLTRAGYILKKFQNIQYYNNVQLGRATTTTITAPRKTNSQKSDEDCIWYILAQELHSKDNQRNDLENQSLCKNMPNYDKFKKQFEQIKKQIMNPDTSASAATTATTTTSKCNDGQFRQGEKVNSQTLNFNRKFKSNRKRSAEVAGITKPSKRNANNWRKFRRARNEENKPRASVANTTNTSLLDFLAADETFKKFDLIPMQSSIMWNESETSTEENITEDEAKVQDINDNLIINFDVYLPKSDFRKSDPGPPDFRVIILEPNQSFPTHQQISKIYWQQLQQITLMIMAVNESKQVQAFLYYFS